MSVSTQGPECRDIGKLYARFELLREQLGILHDMSRGDTCDKKMTDDMRNQIDRETDDVHLEMQALSARAAELKACCPEHLCMKAKILLERRIPEDDDISRLAASICEDLLALQVSPGGGSGES